MKRGYYSLILITILYGLSWILPILVNNKALIVSYNNQLYFPAFHDFSLIENRLYRGSEFGQDKEGQADYLDLQKQWKETDSQNWLIMPLYPHDPYSDINSGNKMYEAPFGQGGHILGTDDTGRDVFARLVYAFNISISFALILTILNYIIGISIGGAMGYFDSNGQMDTCISLRTGLIKDNNLYMTAISQVSPSTDLISRIYSKQ